MSHYELTNETKTVDGVVLHRIRATADLPVHGVEAGDLGGWVESEANLSGTARVFGDAQVSGTAHIQTIAPIGSENVTATIHKTTTGHALHIGCWTGTLDTLNEEVERRAANWNQDMAGTWHAQYKALHALFTATVDGWEAGA